MPIDSIGKALIDCNTFYAIKCKRVIMFVGKENSRNNLEQNRGKSLKLVSLTSF